MTNILNYFRCFYLTFVFVFLLLAYHQYLNLKQKHRLNGNYVKEDQIDSKKVYKVNDVASDIEVSFRTFNYIKVQNRFLSFHKLTKIDIIVSIVTVAKVITTLGLH